jgi:outer membrane protein
MINHNNMKKNLLMTTVLFVACLAANAQKYALIDMEYILKNIPAYERANEQLNQISKKWQGEVEAVALEAQTLYKNYQSEAVFLSEEQKTKKEEEIVTKEKEAQELKRKYFGPEGELYKKRESLMAPIQDEIYNAVFNQYSVDRIKLVGYCLLKKMRVFAEHQTALIYLSRKELYKFNFQSGDAEGIVNMPLQSKDIYYSVFMREDKATAEEMAKNGGIKTKIKVSLRSQGDRPVNIFARDVFNGGGHANASGGEHYGSLEEAVQKFLDNYTKYFKK